jgi:hypothetical protein
MTFFLSVETTYEQFSPDLPTHEDLRIREKEKKKGVNTPTAPVKNTKDSMR